MTWLWITLAAVLGGALLLLITLLLLGLSAQRGGFGLRVLQGFQRLLLRFPLTRRWVMRSAEKALDKAAEMPPDMLKDRGIDQQTARQARDLLASMSDEGRERLLTLGTQLERPDASEDEHREAMREASDLIIEDLGLSRAQRRRAERAQAQAVKAAGRPGGSKKKSAKKGKKKR